MKKILNKIMGFIMGKSKGMEMVEAAILIAIVVALGLIFKTQLTSFVNKIFGDLMNTGF